MELTGNTLGVPLMVGTCSGADRQHFGCTCHGGDL